MDPIAMAAAAVAALSPYLVAAAKGAGGKVGLKLNLVLLEDYY